MAGLVNMAEHMCFMCDECTGDVCYCIACAFNLCNKCWIAHPPHRKGLLGPQNLPHEKADPRIVQELTDCMAEPTEEEEYRYHQEDEETTWFGLERNDGGEPILAEYRRYAAVMMQASEQAPRTRYPSLVSFVGQTGAGKSSLINLLVGLNSSTNAADDEFGKLAPIIGRSSSAIPTSADVHLYLSPETRATKRPILYADCEGFEGGERSPIAVNAMSAERPASKYDKDSKRPHVVRKVSQGTKRLLKWASHDSQAYESTSKRGYAVSEMYPRIFYAFSDVIVFVLDNPKTLEVVVERLLEWADANYSRSINQPTKPHAIIALNKSNPKTPDDQWSTTNATANLLNTTSAKIDENKTFVKYAQLWKKVSLSRIDNMHDLLRCYYSTVHVVRLPEKSRFQLLNQQRQQLHEVIENCCAMSYQDKQERELLTDVDDFGFYLSLAFDHFSETLDMPFDFVEASLKRNPLPASLADNLYVFARRIAHHNDRLKGHAMEVFRSMTKFVASCILLESARKQRIGRPEDWFGDEEDDEIQGNSTPNLRRSSSLPKRAKSNTYREMCRTAILRYFNNDVKCGASIPDPLALKSRPCELTYNRHDSTHRAKARMRSIEAPGTFKMDFERDELYSWEQEVLAQMIHLHDRLRRQSLAEYRLSVVRAHAELLPIFYQAGHPDRSKIAELHLNSVCVACLSNPPQHQLACGHIICLECAKDFGQQNGGTIMIDMCPLRDEQSQGPNTKQIELLPSFSGLRILTLDGGGIRGIVELLMLKSIENAIGIPLQRFFDLVIGSSTGGVIALGLGHLSWSLDECISNFKQMMPYFFSKRKGQDYKGIRRIQLFVKHSKYETTPLERVLREAFGSEALFDGGSDDRLKTAVTAVSSSGSRAWLLSNYNTLHQGTRPKPEYRRYRPERPIDEILTWEAARTTSAGPGFFRPFSIARAQGDDWIDGAVLHNNPVEIALEEGRRIAAVERLNPEPDILLSIGTGLSSKLRQLSDIPTYLSHKSAPKAKTTGWIRHLFTMVSYQVKLSTDADTRWQQVQDTDRHISKKLYRINPDLQIDPPELDEVDKIDELAELVPRLIATDSRLSMNIQEIACALVASSFYFERNGPPISKTSSSTEVHGWICCRLNTDARMRRSASTSPTMSNLSLSSDVPSDIMQLGLFISKSQRPNFMIYNETRNMEDVYVPVPLSQMIQNGAFIRQKVCINVSGDDAITTIALRLPGLCGRVEFPISGFPRQLMKMDYSPSYKNESLGRVYEAPGVEMGFELP